MLTPQEVSGRAFSKAAFGGYNMAMVDEFLDELTDDYTSLYKENAALKAKLKVLVDKVEEYRATEDSMRAALLTAQRMANTMVEEAEEKKKAVLAGAEDEARAKIGALQSDVELEQRAARQGYTLHHTPAAAKVLAGDKVPPYGARELRRTVSRAVEQALADRIAAGTAHPGTVYTADVDADGHIILTEDTLAACV